MRFLCLLCAHHNVPDVRTYLGVRAIVKFGIKAFQRRVPIQIPTKTRCCSSLESQTANCGVLLLQTVHLPDIYADKGVFQETSTYYFLEQNEVDNQVCRTI